MKVLLASLLLCLAGPRPAPAAPAAGPSPPPEPSVSPPAPSPTPEIPGQELSGGFIRYIPNREGDYEWMMKGDAVSFLSPVCLEITRLTATALAPNLEGLTIEAGTMSYCTDTGIARSDGARIAVRRKDTVLTGKGYLWTPANRQLRVFEDIRLLIQESEEGGLFPR